MANPLGNPEDQASITVTTTAQQVQVTHGLQSIEFINMGNKDIYYGKLSTLTSARGAPIYSQGGRRTFENIPAGWKISFITADGTSELRILYYQ